MNIDQAKEKFNSLYTELTQSCIKIETEQDARFQVIDRILTEVLGWQREEILTEPHTDSGYIDYLITSRGRSRLVVEAKRTSKLLIDTRQPRMAWYKVGGSALESAADGLNQAKRYCTDKAVLFCALTTGFEWIGFWALRTDGKPPSEGKAIAFPNLESIQQNFATFYDVFSREGILEDLYKTYIYEAEGLKISHNESLYSVLENSDRYLLTKSALFKDIENVYHSFFTSMSGEDDPDMLAKCFVESKESREADENLQKITRNLLNRIDIVNSAKGIELQNQIRNAVELQKGEFVLIIGNKGAGKTTFIDRFFRLILDKSLRENCLLIRVDLADSNGEKATITSWLTEKLKIELENGLFKGEYPSYSELQGVFYQEYQRWRCGERKPLYERNKNEFKEKFGEYIADFTEKHPDDYVMKLIKNATKARGLMPCIVFDNTDHFPQIFQEAVFQYAQSIYRKVFSFIICPITDRTIWQLSKSGPLQSYENQAFYLPVPSTKDVLAKRIEFIKEKAIEDSEGSKKYFTKKGIRLSIPNISAFAFAVEDIFINEDYIGRIVGWLSNHDIRRSLQIARRIITSPIIEISVPVNAYVIGKKSHISHWQIKKALLVGDYNHFYQKDSNFILNLFEVQPSSITSPLLRLSILRLLSDTYSENSDAEKNYLYIDDILNYFEPVTINRILVKEHLKALLDYRLIETYDPTDANIYESQRVKITPCGRIHYEFAVEEKEGIYIGQMALNTPIASQSYLMRVRDFLKKKRTRQDWVVIIKLFVEYCLQQDSLYISLPQKQIYDSQRKLRERISQRWT
ncbi:MAG: AAA family ATPase [Nostoc sp. JL34]|uniref:AAA family ATPase n=1 Tax=Nostoc sp. JL34 TaxID=2815397 RepID=UPI001DAB9E8B|nr:AAA family ATPase [Nostoc sp. JL34]MBN3882117.1 AAA family ATPase [Nostoc sp. JL34]